MKSTSWADFRFGPAQNPLSHNTPDDVGNRERSLFCPDGAQNFLARAFFENGFDHLGLSEIQVFEFVIDGSRMETDVPDLRVVDLEKVTIFIEIGQFYGNQRP